MRSLLIAALLLTPTLLPAQKSRKEALAGYERSARAVVLHVANLYTTADDSGQPVTTVTPGHEIVVIERNGPWVRIFANTEEPDRRNDTPEFAEEQAPPMSGWIHDKGIVNSATPNGDTILFGAAAEFEAQAAQPHAPKGAAQSAHMLYQRVFQYFPDSRLAPEAAFRAADIRWQLDKLDISTLPSAHEQEAYLRPQLYENDLKDVMKHYQGTKFVALAAYDLIDNKLCGDWQGLPKCPEQETNLYLKYAEQFPGGPKSAEALYNAVYRQGVLVTMYQVQDDKKRSQAAGQNAIKIAQQMKTDYPDSDFTARAASIAYRVQQGINTYGTDRE